jgi:hypothetical protein
MRTFSPYHLQFLLEQPCYEQLPEYQFTGKGRSSTER